MYVWFGLNNSSNRDIMFIPRKFGGLGVIPLPHTLLKRFRFCYRLWTLMILKLDIVHAHHLSYIWKNVEWIRIILILHLLAIVLMKTVGWLSNVRLIGLNRFGSSSMNCACAKALGWRCLATSMCISPLLITRLLLFCAINLLRSIISKASIWIIASPGLRQRYLKAEFWARLASIFKSRTIISPILLSMIIWSSSSLRHVCNFLNVTLFCTDIILVFIPSHAYFVTTHLTLLLMFSMVAWFSMTCISNVMTGSLTTFILNSLLAVLSSLCM